MSAEHDKGENLKTFYFYLVQDIRVLSLKKFTLSDSHHGAII